MDLLRGAICAGLCDVMNECVVVDLKVHHKREP